MVVPLLGLIGMGADVERTWNTRTMIETGLDAAVLAGALTWRKTGDIDEAKKVMIAYLDGNAADKPMLKGTVWKIESADPDTGEFAASGHKDVKMLLLPVFHINTLPAHAVAKAKALGRKLELAMVLDTTGSMAGTKIRDLRSAATSVVDIFEKYMDKELARMSLVTFADAVNLGKYANASSVWRSGDVGKTRKQQVVSGGKKTFTRTNCVSEIGAVYTLDGDCAIAPMIALTSDADKLRRNIDAIEAAGVTAGHIGVLWGGKTLDPANNSIWNTDDTDADTFDKVKDGRLMKVAIIMTDGEYNTQYCNGIKDEASGSLANRRDLATCSAPKGRSQVQADNACEDMKKQGIEIYTVGFKVQNFQRQSLKDCATDSQHAYFPLTGEDLSNVFQQIGYAVEAGLIGARITQ
jgi:hypothetical protein